MPAKARMRTRVGHCKSRNGCARCKARRVKCDEQQPCYNCVRHKVQCSLGPDNGKSGPPASINKPAIIQPRAAIDVRGKITKLRTLVSEIEASVQALETETLFHRSRASFLPAQTPPGEVDGGDDSSSFSADWMQNLRLFHHYCTSVCLTLSSDSTTKDLWQTAVPDIACSHDFLMRGLLAISSLHYAYTHPNERKAYVIVSTHYQNLALQSFSNHLASINDDNCEAYFLLATFIFLFTASSIANPQDQQEPVTPNDIVQSFLLLQGVRSIIDYKPIQKWRESGPLAALMRPIADTNRPRWTRIALTHLDRLHTSIQELSPEVADNQTRSLCLLTLSSLRDAFFYPLGDESSAGAHHRMSWPITLPQTFLTLLVESHPVSLVILTYYALLFQTFDRSKWAFRGWSNSVLTVVERELDPQWQHWIKWPKQCILADANAAQ